MDVMTRLMHRHPRGCLPFMKSAHCRRRATPPQVRIWNVPPAARRHLGKDYAKESDVTVRGRAEGKRPKHLRALHQIPLARQNRPVRPIKLASSSHERCPGRTALPRGPSFSKNERGDVFAQRALVVRVTYLAVS
jgi:hypothetical protein